MPKTPLRKAREAMVLTQHEVAERARIDQSHYARIERHGSSCSPEVAERLARIFRRQGITESHVLYPRRYSKFRPGAAA